MNRQENYNLLESALKYAADGFAVFPLIPGEKRPAIAHGFKDATKDAETIRRWWTENPAYNIGIATGSLSGGLLVVDIDNGHKEGVSGSENLARWELENGMLPTTAMVRTPSGGYHLYFRNTSGQDFKSYANVIESVDVRSDGGYVVAPPSIRADGKLYTWSEQQDDKNLAEVSPIVCRLLSPARKNAEPIASTPAGKPETLIAQGGRVQALVSLIGVMIANGLTPEATQAAIRAENASRCSPPLTEEELKREVFPALTRTWETRRPYSRRKKDVFTEEDLTLKSFLEIEERPLEWLVPGYIPIAGVTLLVAAGGVGKTAAWCSIVSAVSRGARTILENTPGFIDPTIGAKKVLIFSKEDDSSMVLRKRLQLNNFNPGNVITIELDDQNERLEWVTFKSKYLELLIAKYRPALVVFDPIQSFLEGNVKMSDRHAMRDNLGALPVLSKKYGCAFLIVVHCNKMSGIWGRQRMADSSDIWDVSRSVLMLGEASDGHVYLSHEKCNYGELQPTILAKIVKGVMIAEGTTEKKDKDFVLESMSTKRNDRSGSAQEDCENYIISALKDAGEDGLLMSDLDDELQAMSFSKHAARKAKEALKASGEMITKKEGFKGKHKAFSRDFYKHTEKNSKYEESTDK